jgi:hypothetical protein
MSNDIAQEAAGVLAAIESYSRRMFDLGRDPIWNGGGRDDAAERLRSLSRSMLMLADIVADPDSGSATDDALNKLLGR